MKLYKMKVVRWRHQHGTEGIGGRRLGEAMAQKWAEAPQRKKKKGGTSVPAYIGVRIGLH